MKEREGIDVGVGSQDSLLPFCGALKIALGDGCSDLGNEPYIVALFQG